MQIKYMVQGTLEQVNKNVLELKKKVEILLSEDFELSEHAKKALKEARETPEAEYVDL